MWDKPVQIGSSKYENLKLRRKEGKDRSTGCGRSYIDPYGSRAQFTDRRLECQLPVRAFTAQAVTLTITTLCLALSEASLHSILTAEEL